MMNMRNTDEAKIGDTFFHENKRVEPLPGFKDATPMVRHSSRAQLLYQLQINLKFSI